MRRPTFGWGVPVVAENVIVRKQSAMWEDKGDGLCRDKTGLEEMIPTDGIPVPRMKKILDSQSAGFHPWDRYPIRGRCNLDG